MTIWRISLSGGQQNGLHVRIGQLLFNKLKIHIYAKDVKDNFNDTQISVLLNLGDADYLSLTDMTRSFEDGNKLIEKWLNNKSTIDYIGFGESINNPDFKTPEFGGIRMEAGTNRFYISVNKFVEKTGAIGIFSKAELFDQYHKENNPQF